MGFSENNVTFKATFGEVCKVGGGGGAVNSVNGKTGDVVLTASDVGAYTTEETNTKLSSKADKSEIPTVPEKISDLVDDTYETMPIGRADVCYQADYAKRADEAGSAGHADDASRDQKGNIIHETYATKEELSDISVAVHDVRNIKNLGTIITEEDFDDIKVPGIYLSFYDEEYVTPLPTPGVEDAFAETFQGVFKILFVEKVSTYPEIINQYVFEISTRTLKKRSITNNSNWTEWELDDAYATKKEVGNINEAIDAIEAIQNQLIGGASE